MPRQLEQRRDYVGGESASHFLQHIGHTINQKSRPGLGPHMHTNAFEICYLRKGEMHWWAGDVGNDYTVAPGELTLTYPNEIHGGVDSIHGSGDLYWMSIELDAKGFDMSAGMMAELDQALRTLPRHFQAPKHVPMYYEDIMTAIEDPGPFAQLRLRSGVTQFLMCCIDAGRAARMQQGQRDLRFERVKDAIYQQPEQFQHVDDLAVIAGLSPNRFINHFKAYTGYSPMDFVNREKIKAAKRMLVESDRSIIDIAMHFDFSSSQYFATFFKKYTGMTPTQFRRTSFF